MKSLIRTLILLLLSFFLAACSGDSANTTYTIGGTVAGLEGTGLVLQNNNDDDIAISADGSFTFVTALANKSAYSITVLTQPSSLNQICTVANGSGTISGSNITNVSVTCVTNTYSIGGSVSGLAGTGLVLQNNSADDLVITANGGFTFSTAITDGAGYNITVLSQPTSLPQSCAVSNGSGTLSGTNITNVAITCTTNTYTIGGSVTGLSGSGLVLQNNGTDNLPITTNGSSTFTFATAITDGAGYNITVLSQPTSLSQSCAVSNGSGTLSGTNITNVAITCTTNTYSIGGTVSGLAGTGLVLQNNSADDLVITSNGDFTFSTAITDGNGYSVTVLTQPTGLPQTCAVSNSSGTVAGANITNVAITCTTNAYNIGGAVSGLTGTGLVLQNNATDNLSITAGGSFIFATAITHDTGYSATILTQPTGQFCTISNNSGTVAGADVTNISVECAQAYTNASLNGDYLFTMTEVHDPGSAMTYCGLSGTLSFDGAGNVLVSGTKRCSDGSAITVTAISGPPDTYVVIADGSFTYGSPSTHGQIVLDGSSLLLDGTSKGTNTGDYLDRGVAMKRVTAGEPPTYNAASLNDDYLFALTEIHNPGTVTYCDEAGNLVFGGTGTATGGSSTMRCSDGATVTTTSDPGGGTLYYAVAPDGSFTLSDSATDPEPLHGQILLDGNSMLADTSLMATTGAHLMDLIAMKKVTAGSPPTYSNTSLKGDYLFNFTEVFNPGTTTYCDQAGTLSFDGAGIALGNGEMRCSDGVTVTTTTFSDTLDYDVASDGSFALGGLIEPLHGQIALDGSSLLLDGTLTGTTATKLLNKGIAMKRVADELVGTWVVCKNEGPFDEKEVLTFDGAAGTITFYLYTSTDGSCSAGESSNGSDTFTYTTGGMITTSLSGSAVNATTIDAAFFAGGDSFQIFYIDPLSTPDNLYMGDETADPSLDGSTALKRPIALQEALPRLRQ